MSNEEGRSIVFTIDSRVLAETRQNGKLNGFIASKINERVANNFGVPNVRLLYLFISRQVGLQEDV